MLLLYGRKASNWCANGTSTTQRRRAYAFDATLSLANAAASIKCLSACTMVVQKRAYQVVSRPTMSVISFAGARSSLSAADDWQASLVLRMTRRVSFFDATCLTLAAAAMIGDACLHLIPETFEGTDERDGR